MLQMGRLLKSLSAHLFLMKDDIWAIVGIQSIGQYCRNVLAYLSPKAPLARLTPLGFFFFFFFTEQFQHYSPPLPPNLFVQPPSQKMSAPHCLATIPVNWLPFLASTVEFQTL